MIMHREAINSGEGSTIIIGAGLAGLATAIKTKQVNPARAVTVIDKPQQQSNSLVAGQRFREGIPGRRTGCPSELTALLSSRNNGLVTAEMELFARVAYEELACWQSASGFVEFQDSKEWFGPQWGVATAAGKGRGRSVVGWFAQCARELDIQFMTAEVDRVLIDEGSSIGALEIEDSEGRALITADNYVVAAGNAGGYLFESTNRAIKKSGTELLFEAGMQITDTTVHMLHPFGRSNNRGESTIGCFETDNLDKADVYLDGLSSHPILDRETTELLRMHEAHDHFPRIVRKFCEFGGVVLLTFPDDTPKIARVSHHYSHFGIPTEDGVRSSEIDNLFVVGDAAGVGYWTNHKERFPGFALTKALVDARIASQPLADEKVRGRSCVSISRTTGTSTIQCGRPEERNVRKVNTKYLLDLVTMPKSRSRSRELNDWVDELDDLGYDSPQIRLSKYVAHGYKRRDE
jgi:aspartate oxidase